MEDNRISKRKRAQVWGIAAEYLCILLLLLKGYTILQRRHRNRGGEIDIIAVRGMQLAFIEVKARAQETDALESITADKRRRLARAAEAFIAGNKRYAQHGLRFDVMVITSPWKIRHLKDAWRAE
jgi:putative endonuclease